MTDDAPPAAPPTPAAPLAGTTGFDVTGIQQQVASGTVLRFNPEQELLMIYANALRLRLRDFETAIKHRDAWKGPAGLALGFLSTLITIVGNNDFKLFGYGRDAWMLVVGLALLLSAARAGIAGGIALLHRKGNTVEDVIKDIPRRVTPQ